MNYLDDRYLKDPNFMMLVDCFEQMVIQQKTSWSEVREAALFAQLRYEMRNPTPAYLSPQLLEEIKYRTRS